MELDDLTAEVWVVWGEMHGAGLTRVMPSPARKAIHNQNWHYSFQAFLDMPSVVSELVEEPEPDAPYGVKGVGEPPTLVSTPAIVAALRDATARDLTRVPVRPDDIVGL